MRHESTEKLTWKFGQIWSNLVKKLWKLCLHFDHSVPELFRRLWRLIWHFHLQSTAHHLARSFGSSSYHVLPLSTANSTISISTNQYNQFSTFSTFSCSTSTARLFWRPRGLFVKSQLCSTTYHPGRRRRIGCGPKAWRPGRQRATTPPWWDAKRCVTHQVTSCSGKTTASYFKKCLG